jgi:LL-diaminopimelate aminotransferase
MAKISANYGQLKAGYLFPEVGRRANEFEKRTGITPIRLGIGDTTEPLAPSVIKAMHESVDRLARVETYSGYGPEQGKPALREAIIKQYKRIPVELEPAEIFVSDGAKCDSGNIQSIFAINNVVAIQDPAYPVYVDTNIAAGRWDPTTSGIVYMPCNEGNGFFPSLPKEKVDLIYICSPNNPTGAVASGRQLKTAVDYAKENKAIIIFDAAYSAFIKTPSYEFPNSIYWVEGAKECAIEINSFSKSAGFTSLRLAWTVVPKELVAEDSAAKVINGMWNRRQTTFFNGSSIIAQDAGIAALSETGLSENQKTINYYMTNASIIRNGLNDKGFTVHGGYNAPFLWVKTPNGMDSWKFFDKMLEEAHVVITPGAGFGKAGEGYFRVSAFGHRENIEKAVKSIRENLRV